MILITGASGFVGQNLVKKLVGEGLKVRCLVRDRNKISESNAVEVIQGDICDKAVLYGATQDVETIIHLAAVIKSANPEEFMNVNVKGIENLVEACLKNRVNKLIYVSSLDAALEKTNTYGKTKAIGEDIIKNSNLPYVILRPALIYGKGSKDMGMLIELIKKYPLIPVPGSGKGKLQPVYIDDICDIFLKLIKSNIRNKTYYVAGEQKISLNDLIDKIAAISSKKIFKIHIPLWILWFPLKLRSLIIGGPQITYESLSLFNQDKICEITGIKNAFNFEPKSIDDGLRLVLHG